MEAGETNNAVTQVCWRQYRFKHCLYSYQHSLPLFSSNGLDQSHLSGTTFARSTDKRSLNKDYSIYEHVRDRNERDYISPPRYALLHTGS